MEANGTDTASIVAAAQLLVGCGLSEPVDLGGSARSTVLRVRTADGGSVVIKKYADAAGSRTSFAAEASGLAFADSGPRLLAADPEALMVVLEDLGSHPSLADRLLGDSAESADGALREWATCYGRLAAGTVGREAELDRLIGEYGRGPDRDPEAFANRLVRYAQAFSLKLTGLGLRVPAGFDEEIAGISKLLSADTHRVFSPGDICPDNNLLTPGGLRMLDFEGASFHSVFLDAAYARMPFATCWCVYALPEGLAAQIEELYRAEVVRALPDLADDRIWQPGLRAAVAFWTVCMSTFLLDNVMAEGSASQEPHEGDASAPPDTTPHVRQILRYRWQSLVDQHEADGELPALTAGMRALLEATAGWKVDLLPLYPAWRSS
jgi:hypothetical protein